MKRLRYVLLTALLACLLALAGCRASVSPLPATPAPDSAQSVSYTPAEGAPVRESAVTLWFRFLSEPCLAPEERTIALSPTEPYELTLLRALLGGPSAISAELRDPFPAGTQVLSTVRQGRLLFVTLSHHVLDGYADEPANWANQPQWAQEVPLRRELAMQAIVATITENCDVDQVVVLVDQPGQITDSLRLREGYYQPGSGDMALAPPLERCDALLLDQQTAMDVILTSWSERSWARLYLYISRQDAATGEPRPDYAAFVEAMERLPHLIRFEVTGGSVNHAGDRATFTLEGVQLRNGVEEPFTGVMRLNRENGLWRISMSQLTAREVASP